ADPYPSLRLAARNLCLRRLKTRLSKVVKAHQDWSQPNKDASTYAGRNLVQTLQNTKPFKMVLL
ncbi:hypothetical protein CHS0354_019640, partial [Potamilus streckersoni]